MEQAPELAKRRGSSPRDDASNIDLRRFWRLRAGLAGLALTFCVVFFGAMTFAGRPEKPTPPTPAQVEAAWQKLVSETLAARTPADQHVALPTSQYARRGLMSVRAAD